ncbi:MAG: JAB domain-containing protein [Bacteroidetes bacterium]|nr:JAB domain-containing protein [Bacteroidota bacterium]
MFSNIAEIQVSYKSQTNTQDRIKITTSKGAFEVLKQISDPDTLELREYFYVLCLNRANQVMGFYNLGIGSVAGCVVDIKHLIAVAIKTNSSSIIIGHNHPSGNLTPSKADERITQQIKEAARLFDIALHDHVIFTNENYFSFADEGRI